MTGAVSSLRARSAWQSIFYFLKFKIWFIIYLMKCIKCSTMLPDEAHFCFNCGYPTSDVKVLRSCEECGNTLSTMDKFCSRCGVPVKVVKEGAGAAQTMMNLHGVRPGRRILMLGSGNVGLVVSFQLLQAGCEVVALVDAAPRIGGYGVHAAKVARTGVPFYLGYTI